MGDLMKDSQNYYNFLQASLSSSANEQNLGQSLQSEIEQNIIGSTESKEMGQEMLISTAPGLGPMIFETFQKAQKIYQNIQEVGSQLGKVTDAVKSIPSDIKALYGAKVNNIEELLKSGSEANLAKAKSLYGDLQATVQKAATTGKSIVTESANKMVDLTTSTIEKGKDMASGLLEQGKTIATEASSKIGTITGDTANLIKNTTVNSIEDVNKLRDSLYTVKGNFQNLVSEQSAKIDAHIQTIKDTVPVEQQEELISKAETMRSDLTTELKNTYLGLKQSMIEKSEANPEIYAKVSNEMEQLKTPETFDSLFPMRGGMEKSIAELMAKKPALGAIVSKNAEEVSTLGEETIASTRALVTQPIEQLSTTVSKTASDAAGLATRTSVEANQLVSQTAAKGDEILTSGVDKSTVLVEDTTAELAKTAKAAEDLVAENAAKFTGAAETFGKMGLEDLAEISGVSAIPVVGTVLGVAGLIGGVVEGIKDLFTHVNQPAIVVPQASASAGIVHQAGL